jgi:hypothetical protein
MKITKEIERNSPATEGLNRPRIMNSTMFGNYATMSRNSVADSPMALGCGGKSQTVSGQFRKLRFSEWHALRKVSTAEAQFNVLPAKISRCR